MRFENVLNWGNIITLVVMGVGGLVAFSKVQSEVTYMRDALIEIRREDDATDIRLRSLELGFGRIEERLIAIQNILQNASKP
ncbi:hypothetical protein G5V65_21020 [Rhodobacter sp. HX-7-19]|uniref:Uncharacterized protein n=1 Tax=Paragemmobacter kunshanensis TaxID=2583234 RepID=A0A6M1U3R7_9RHOB|nr:hypothetical protein [Rhodobacter kunshanensis]NGQ93372.1 hypothetical protein [Rhodobacter kunshanensis]